MTVNLKRCPFCGSEAEFNSDEFGEGVCCKSCSATMRNGVYGECGRKLASADWNARPIENELNEKIEKLEAENKRLREALELIAKSNFYFARGEEDKQLSRVCEIARNALNGNEK